MIMCNEPKQTISISGGLELLHMGRYTSSFDKVSKQCRLMRNKQGC